MEGVGAAVLIVLFIVFGIVFCLRPADHDWTRSVCLGIGKGFCPGFRCL